MSENIIDQLKAICESCNNKTCKCKQCLGIEKKCGDSCGFVETIESHTECKNYWTNR